TEARSPHDSGVAMNHDPLTQFFYLLMRDKCPSGEVEWCMEQVRKSAGMDVTHSAPHLEAYAASLAAEIRSIAEASHALRSAPPQNGST
ncbi:MAG: hypothetical protein ACM32F_08460, partial [Betaproteobacteria bacterium]